MSARIITYRSPKSSPSRDLTQLQPSALVTVYDAISEQDEEYQVADVVERDGRIRVRVVGQNYYFDSNLVKEVRADGN
jgi:hypothetical protein